VKRVVGSDGSGARSTLALTIVWFLSLSQFATPTIAEDNPRARLAYSAFSVAFLNVFIARDAGMFERHGFEAELIQMAGPIPIAALGQAKLTISREYTTGLVATGQGVRLKEIMVIPRRPPFYVIA
jgi:hypothetical protein